MLLAALAASPGTDSSSKTSPQRRATTHACCCLCRASNCRQTPRQRLQPAWRAAGAAAARAGSADPQALPTRGCGSRLIRTLARLPADFFSDCQLMACVCPLCAFTYVLNGLHGSSNSSGGQPQCFGSDQQQRMRLHEAHGCLVATRSSHTHTELLSSSCMLLQPCTLAHALHRGDEAHGATHQPRARLERVRACRSLLIAWHA